MNRLLTVALCGLVISACAGPQALRTLPDDTAALPRAAEAGVDERIPHLFPPWREGGLQPDLHAAARRHSRVPYPVAGSLPALFAEVAAGHPVIVLQNPALPFRQRRHYAVVTGYDLDRGAVRLHSGEHADRTVGLRRFETAWARAGHWAMVVLPPGDLPAGIDARSAIIAAHDFERVAGPAPAVHAWAAITGRWPDEALAWFARGNAHHARDELEFAGLAFARAVEADPGLGPAWINLGRVRVELGDRAGGIAALRKALELDGPWREAAQRALVETLAGPTEF